MTLGGPAELVATHYDVFDIEGHEAALFNGYDLTERRAEVDSRWVWPGDAGDLSVRKAVDCAYS